MYHTSRGGEPHFPPGEDACGYLKIYTSKGGLDIYITSRESVPFSYQGRMIVDEIQYTQRLPGEVDNRFTFPSRGGIHVE